MPHWPAVLLQVPDRRTAVVMAEVQKNQNDIKTAPNNYSHFCQSSGYIHVTEAVLFSTYIFAGYIHNHVKQSCLGNVTMPTEDAECHDALNERKKSI